MQEQFSASGPQRVFVEVQSGAVTVRTGASDRLEIEVAGPGAEWVEVDRQGDRLSVVARRSSGFLARNRDVDVDLLVPEGSRLAARLGSAALTVTGVLGAVDVATGSGEVWLDEVTGPALVKTGSGGIAIRAAGSGTDVKTGSGDVRVGRLDGGSRLVTGSGSIEVEHAGSGATLKSGSGDLLVGAAEGDTTLRAASGELRIGRMARGRADLKNASGDIHLGIPAGTPVWTDLSTGTGEVRSTLTPVGAPAAGQDHLEVRARTVTGDIHLFPNQHEELS